MNKKLIYIVDDEPDILELVSITLNQDNFATQEFESGKSFWGGIRKQIPDLIVLDLMLPDSNGFEICKQLKLESLYNAIPIILLTARDSEADKVLGLELGADDYVTKPFSSKVLCARVRARLRRVDSNNSLSFTNIKTYKDILQLNENTYEVLVKYTPIHLTMTEFKILSKLLERPSWVVSREDLLAHIWGRSRIVTDRTIDVHIRHIRSKIEQVLDTPMEFIKNIRGVGYKLEI